MTKPKKRAPRKPRSLRLSGTDRKVFLCPSGFGERWMMCVPMNIYHPEDAIKIATWLTKAAAWCRYKNGEKP